MRRKVNVYVFGAGASVHVGGPLTKEFVEKGVYMLCNEELFKISHESFRKVVQFIDILYNKNISAEVQTVKQKRLINVSDSFSFLCNVSIEDLLSFIDIGINSAKDKWLLYSEIQSALYDFIFETLYELTRPYYSDHYKPTSDGTLDHRRNCYDKFIDYLIDINDKNCFITFNYDLFLDKAIAINNHGLLGDYNLDFCKVNNFPSYERFQLGNRKSEDVDILKLHGSLNWKRCPQCNRIYLDFHSDYKSIFKKTSSCCNIKLVPVLVPPTLRKNIESYGIGCLWDKADEILSVADSLTIIGYSFPDADIEAKWLFKRSVAKGGKRPNLILVEPVRKVREKLINIFGNTVSEITEYKNFKKYCEGQHL